MWRRRLPFVRILFPSSSSSWLFGCLPCIGFLWPCPDVSQSEPSLLPGEQWKPKARPSRLNQVHYDAPSRITIAESKPPQCPYGLLDITYKQSSCSVQSTCHSPAALLLSFVVSPPSNAPKRRPSSALRIPSARGPHLLHLGPIYGTLSPDWLHRCRYLDTGSTWI